MDDVAAQGFHESFEVWKIRPDPGGGLADLIAYAWFTIGFRPRESLVVIGLAGCRLGAVGRIDRPPASQERASLAGLADLVGRGGADAVFLLVVTDRPGVLPLSGFARRVRRRFEAAGFDVLDVAHVGADRYRSYTCTDELCCPATGFPLAGVTSSVVAAGMVALGHVVAQDEAGLVADVAPVECAERWPQPARRVGITRRRTWFAQWCSVAEGRPVGIEDRAWLAPALDDLPTRDAIMVSLARPGPAGRATARALLEGRQEGLAAALNARPPASDETAERCRSALALLASRAPRGRRAPALAVLAWWSWSRGEGTRARLLTAAALQDRADHSLATLVAQLVRHGVPPEWVRASRPVGVSECRDSMSKP
jgi:Domain of unknown function (DUF4192)